MEDSSKNIGNNEFISTSAYAHTLGLMAVLSHFTLKGEGHFKKHIFFVNPNKNLALS